MTALGEMATLIPHKKGFGGYATRFIDPAAGFAVGYVSAFTPFILLLATPENLVITFRRSSR